ncbi:MAG: phosphotransferase [Terracoccus sp.]
MIDVEQAQAVARSIVEAALGADPGRMGQVPSASHQVFVGSTVVVKIVDAIEHTRLDREIALALDLPVGLSAPVLAHGRYPTGGGDVRYACLARAPGASPGMGLAGVDRPTAREWAYQAVHQLQRLHEWTPSGPTAAVLAEPLDHGGFVGRPQLLEEIEIVRALDREETVPRKVIDSLLKIADRSPEHIEQVVPVHADCHWGNWLVHDTSVTALLDFEWARFGEPAEDWMFLSRFSGPHMQTVLNVIADLTATPLETLRAACEVREAAYVISDLRLKLQDPARHAPPPTARNIGELEEIIIGRSWWQPER